MDSQTTESLRDTHDTSKESPQPHWVVALIDPDCAVPLQVHSILRSESLEATLLGLLLTAETKTDDSESYILTPTLLIRPRESFPSGLSAYALSSVRQQPDGNHQAPPNTRATRLAMACGLWELRFRGPILIAPAVDVTSTVSAHEMLQALQAATTSPDLRREIKQQLAPDISNTKDAAISIPDWLGDATLHNYHDQSAIQRLAQVMVESNEQDEDEEESIDEDDDARRSDNDDDESNDESGAVSDGFADQDRTITTSTPTDVSKPKSFVATSPLCLTCRKPCNDLCPNCQGAYFCNDTCRKSTGWSHDCMCDTWKIYVHRRGELSSFDGLGSWCQELVGRDCQLSDKPYYSLLNRHDIVADAQNWWRTEFGGWLGGKSESARGIDITMRQSYAQGFAPLTVFPPERSVTTADGVDANLHQRNEVGLLRLESWVDYYRLRGLSSDSIAALLLTFPLSMYYALVEFGQVPCTVARMLKRPLRIHIVGAEKEINFLDLFQEVAFLLPDDISLEFVFIVRDDMLPPAVRHLEDSCKFAPTLSAQLTVKVRSGSYGDSLDPRFDCGSGPPDIVFGFNAGLYAYPTWRSVVQYLNENMDVLGVFTDYNEMSGAQCASLGGAISRESLRMNPFRQPRAMPVYSMNLPQFSNGFFYVYNQQELE